MKKIIYIFLAFAVLALIGMLSFSEENQIGNAKKAYQTASKSVKENWTENKDGIKMLLNELKRFPFEGEILLKQKGSISIRYTNTFDDSYPPAIMLGKDYDDISNLTEKQKDTLISHFFFEGTKEDKNLNFLLSKMNLSLEKLTQIIEDLKEIKCVGVSWNKSRYSIIYLGNPFSGSFEYFFFKQDSELFYRKFYQLEDKYHWGFYESGLYCAPPPYLPN